MARGGAGVEPGAAELARALGLLARFREDVYWSFTRRADALFEVCDAVLLAPGRVTDLARLSLALEFRRGHGALYDALNCGHAGITRLRRALAGLPLPQWADGGIRLAVDVSAWLRPDARASPERLFCRVKGRGERRRPVGAGLALLLRGGAGAGQAGLDGAAGRGPARPGRRRVRGDRRPVPRRGALFN